MTENEIQKSFNDFILSASGWRKVFDIDGETGKTGKVSTTDGFLTFLICKSFEKFLLAKNKKQVVIGRDTRPTGAMLELIAKNAFTKLNAKLIGVATAPEIMAHSKKSATPFIYFSASHNPIGHNGVKFGLTDGGVLGGEDISKLINIFREAAQFSCDDKSVFSFSELETFKKDFLILWKKLSTCSLTEKDLAEKASEKEKALKNYFDFTLETISGKSNKQAQNEFSEQLKNSVLNYKKAFGDFCIVYDFNGSSRFYSIDKTLFEKFALNLYSFNEEKIVHGIIPEGENLKPVAEKIRELAKADKRPIFGLMPDCDGDRGNLVFWEEGKNLPLILNAQDVFALSVLSELSYVLATKLTEKPIALVVNCATSFRIHKIAQAFNAKVFTGEVGEANVVKLAEDLQNEGYFVRILGEGSNGGNITFPARVRDPLNTSFAILKLLVFREPLVADKIETKTPPCLFKMWCKLSRQMDKYKPNFSLKDIIASLPAYTTTATQEKRALLKIKQKDHTLLKRSYQKIFEAEWKNQKSKLLEKYSFQYYKVFGTKGTEEFSCENDFGLSLNGGLKIVFYSKEDNPLGFIWMRGSKTEPVFRVMADIAEKNETAETELVNWHGKMLEKADTLSLES